VKIRLIAIQKTGESYLKEGIGIYEKRIRRYIPFEYLEINSPKKWGNLPIENQKKEEGKLIISAVSGDEHVILLDENGREFTSRKFAHSLQKHMNSVKRSIAFVIGGAYGFSDEVYALANEKMALSKMTFSHQMVRLFAIEQLYRALSILNNDPYHHD
jgi:23S rRNA (pseudouridine1915-N3)-methyltransferase